MSVFEQGTEYNDQRERVRIGEMDGWGAYTGYGFGMGNPVGNRIAYTPATGLQIVGDGGGITNINGGNIQTNTITASQIAANTITATQIAANTITASELAADSVTATHIDVETLSAISANMGTITAGTITGATIRTAASGARIELNSTRIFGTDGTTTQWEALSSNGKLTAGGGNVTLDSAGIKLASATAVSGGFTTQAINWTYGGLFAAKIEGYSGSTFRNLNLLASSPANANVNLTATTSDSTKEVSITLMAERPLGDWALITLKNNSTAKSLDIEVDRTRIAGHLNVLSGLVVGNQTIAPVAAQMRLYNGSTLMGQLSTSDNTWLRINQDVVKDIFTPRAIVASQFSTNSGALMGAGMMLASGYYHRVGTSNYLTSPPITIASSNPYPWYNLTWTSTNNGTKTLTGVPTGVKYIIARLQCQPQGAGSSLSVGPDNVQMDAVIHYGGVANINQSQVVFIRTTSNTVYATVVGTVAGIHLIVLAYGF